MCRGRGLALLKQKFQLGGWMMLVAVAMLTAYDSGSGSNAFSGTASELGSPQAKAAPTECAAGNLFTLVNNNRYPIWLGEFVGDVTFP